MPLLKWSVSLLMQGTVSAEHTLALGSKGRRLEEGAGQELLWQGLEIMRLANFRKGSSAQSGQPDCFVAASFSAMVASINGPEAVGFHSAAIQRGKPRVKSQRTRHGAPNQAWERCME